MAKAIKLPSGAWRTQANKKINGKLIRKSFTVHPKECGNDSKKAKALSELKAREWTLNAEDEENNCTVEYALKLYIKDREKVLSPRTIYDYKRYIPLFESILYIHVSDIKTSDIQPIINEWSISITKKTIQTRISFLLSALDYAGCDKKFKLRYPQPKPANVVSPDVDDVKMLLDNASDIMKPVIGVAAFGSLRRGEIAALKQKDVSRDMCTIYVHADVVQTDNGFIYKDFPKTSGSNRCVQLPKFIIDSFPTCEDPESFVFGLNPNQITSNFQHLRDKLGLKCSFHSLRHYAASFRTDIGIPQKYVEEVGGWKNESTILKRVYDNTLTSSRKKYTQIANNYIEDTFKEQYKKKKA